MPAVLFYFCLSFFRRGWPAHSRLAVVVLTDAGIVIHHGENPLAALLHPVVRADAAEHRREPQLCPGLVARLPVCRPNRKQKRRELIRCGCTIFEVFGFLVDDVCIYMVKGVCIYLLGLVM